MKINQKDTENMSITIDAKEDPIRVFISYSHDDSPKVDLIVRALDKNEIHPMYDKKFLSGQGFHDQIKSYIAHSHVFLPILTETSCKRGWVHQEIGYAMALNIPILPVVLDEESNENVHDHPVQEKESKCLPSQMIHQLHALVISAEELNDENKLQKRFLQQTFDNLVNEYRDPSLCPMRCAALHEERTMVMIQYSNEILKFGKFGFVRQKGGLSSFNIPDKILSDPVWENRYIFPKSQLHNKLQHQERFSFTRHAMNAGCRLIITDGKYIEKEVKEHYEKDKKRYCKIIENVKKIHNIDISKCFDSERTISETAERIRRIRIQSVLDFLNTIPKEKIGILIDKELPSHISETTIGDWFSAEAVTGSLKEGFNQTIFSQHAPSIKIKNELFDQYFAALMKSHGITEEKKTRDHTIRMLTKELK